jgi:hypothetical protein
LALGPIEIANALHCPSIADWPEEREQVLRSGRNETAVQSDDKGSMGSRQTGYLEDLRCWHLRWSVHHFIHGSGEGFLQIANREVNPTSRIQEPKKISLRRK